MSSLTFAASSARVSAPGERVEARPGSFTMAVGRTMLGATLMAMPLAYGAVEEWAWASMAVMTGIIAVIWGIACLRQGEIKLFWSPLYLPSSLFVLWGVVQYVSHSTLDPIATRESLLKLITDFVLFFLAGQFLATASKRTWRRLALSVTVFAFALGVFAILQYFSSQGLIYWTVRPDGWPFGPYVNHNHYAGLMEMLIPIATAYVLSRPRHHPGRLILVVAVAVAIASALLSGSRGGMISLLAEVLLLAILLCASGAGAEWRKVVVLAPFGLLTTALIFFWLDPGEMSGRLATVVKFSRSPDIGMAERETVALDSLRMLRYRLWTGTGLGSFEVAYPQFQSLPSNFSWDHAHNDYAEALVESGLAGGFVILLALFLFFRLAFRRLAEGLRHEVGKIQLGAALGCCGLLVHSAFDFNFHIPANAAWFAVCAAAGTCGTVAAHSAWGVLRADKCYTPDESERGQAARLK